MKLKLHLARRLKRRLQRQSPEPDHTIDVEQEPASTHELEDSPELVGLSGTFKHKPLLSQNNFRLIRLYRNEGDDRVHCDLVEKPISNPPEYHALSYCWGEVTDKVSIICNQKRMLVSQGLHAALLRLLEFQHRPKVRSTYYWIDQLCINQEDINEREEQVQQMANIYRGALRTLVYLGEFDETVTNEFFTPYLTDLIRRLSQHLDKGETNKWTYDDHEEAEVRTSHTLRGVELPLPGTSKYPALRALLKRPWFARTWTVQELALSSSEPFFLCGSFSSSMYDLMQLATLVMRIGGSAGYMTSPLTLMCLYFNEMDTGHLKLRHWSLPTLLNYVDVMQATDNRDKVFGLLGLIRGSDGDEVQPVQADYKSSFTNVYRDVVRKVISWDGDLDILMSAGSVCPAPQSPVPCTDVSCWIPQWNVQSGITTRVGILRIDRTGIVKSDRGPVDASDGLRYSELAPADPNILTVRGIRVTSVERAFLLERTKGDNFVQAWEQVLDYFGIIPDFSDSFLRIARDFVLHLRWPLIYREAHRKSIITQELGRFWSWLSVCYIAHLGDRHAIKRHILAAYRKHASDDEMWEPQSNIGTQAHLFITSTGRVCMGPPTVASSDEIFVVFGSKYPLVLRKCGDTYHLIGDAVVPGMMYGEVVKEWREGKRKVEEIALR